MTHRTLVVRSGALASARSRGARAAPTPEYLITTTTALIYLRISANRTSEHASIEQQRADCTALAGQLGYTRAIEFVDEAISAYQDRARPGYQQLLHQIQESEAGTVIVWHLDRLYRKPRELEQLLDLLDIHPIRVESAQGGSFIVTIRSALGWPLFVSGLLVLLAVIVLVTAANPYRRVSGDAELPRHIFHLSPE
ncbi:recombinase family protein [Microbacterium sp. JB110]|uniref:recombinase family protein n=1 Tax=unclassified Microbacterium TaxID=2609290 RepID=UPI001482DE79|nr:recombinase family protein [Microbacterium sp. JB110]